MLVPRILVPFDAQAPSRESTPEPHPYRRALEGTAASRGEPQGVASPRPLLFAQSMLENSPTKPQGRAKELFVSLTVHGILLAAPFFVPLYFTEAIDWHQFNSTLLVAPPGPPPPPPASAAVVRRPAIGKKLLPITGTSGAESHSTSSCSKRARVWRNRLGDSGYGRIRRTPGRATGGRHRRDPHKCSRQ